MVETVALWFVVVDMFRCFCYQNYEPMIADEAALAFVVDTLR